MPISREIGAHQNSCRLRFCKIAWSFHWAAGQIADPPLGHAQGMHAAIGSNPHLVQHLRAVIADYQNGMFAGEDGIIVRTSKPTDMRIGPPTLDKRRMS